jgi:hypothetical protein
MSVADPSRTTSERLHLRLVDDGAVALALVCCVDDEVVVQDAAVRLGIEGTRVISGVDRNVDELRQAVTCAEGPTLFVVCRTVAFDATKARKAVEVFGTRRVLSHRLLVVELDPKRPGSWTTTVRNAYAAMRRAQSNELDATRDPRMLDCSDRDFVQGETRARTPTPPPMQLGPDGPLVMVAHHAPDAKDGDEDLQSWWRDEVGPIPAHVRTVEPRRLHVVDPNKETAEDGIASISDAVLAMTPARPDAASTVVLPVPTSRVARGAAIAVVVAVVLGFAVAPVLGASRGPSVEMPTIAPIGVASSTAVIADEPPPIASQSAPIAVVPVAVPTPTIERAPEPTAEIVDVDPMERAVADGRVATTDALYVVRGPDRAVDWYGAANHCRARSIAGVSDFRLPSLEELRMLRKADLAPDEAVWSGTRVAGERGSNWVLETRGTMSAQDKHDGRAQVMCVRGR